MRLTVIRNTICVLDRLYRSNSICSRKQDAAMIQMAERNENPIFSFTKCRILFRKAQIFVSQRTDFISFRVVSQSTIYRISPMCQSNALQTVSTTSTASLSRVNEIKNNQRFDLYSRGIHETMSIKLHPLSLASLSTVHIK